MNEKTATSGLFTVSSKARVGGFRMKEKTDGGTVSEHGSIT